MPFTKETLCKQCGEPRDMTIDQILCRKCFREKSTKTTTKWRQSLTPQEKEKYLESIRRSKLKKVLKKFGMSVVDFDNVLIKQKNCCAICKTTVPGGQGNWHVDHDHVTNKFRGLLCSNCNLALGCFHDSIATLENAINYLKITSGPAYDPF